MRATTDSFFTNSVHPCTFSDSQLSLASLSPTNPLRCPVTTQHAVQFLGGPFSRIGEGQDRLFHSQAGESYPLFSLSKTLEEGRNEGVPQRLF